MDELQTLFQNVLNRELIQMILSNSRDADRAAKVKIRPVLIKEELLFQETLYRGTQVFHANFKTEELIARLQGYLADTFRQAQIVCAKEEITVLVSKKGTVTIKKKKKAETPVSRDLSHNRTKKYILKEGEPVDFLVGLGVQTEDGRVAKTYYDKFRQINRFLEFIEDILPRLSRDREITILDFGCGKSYLTFAMYYYLRELKGYDVNIIGLDLKTDVIEKCNSLALRYGYEKLHFYHGDIADYEGVSCVDMVVTLHACDTATDYALAKAVEWGAEVILSVPCCQHEVNKQIENEMLEPVLRYGILKERMSALITDAVRADLLESKGYDTQILEFIDMEHTPKNLLIRAVRTGKRSDQGKVEKMLAALNIHPTLDRLLNEKEQEGSVR